jgi:hypothetical protein
MSVFDAAIESLQAEILSHVCEGENCSICFSCRAGIGVLEAAGKVEVDDEGDYFWPYPSAASLECIDLFRAIHNAQEGR